ncbi:MAG: M28 family peptidase [Phycisphaerales bacterium]
MLHRSAAFVPLAALALAASPAGAEPMPPLSQEWSLRLDEMLSEVSAQRLRDDVDRLAAFGTRHTLSTVEAIDRGVGASRQYVHDEFSKAGFAAQRTGAGRIEVIFDRHTQQPDGRRITREVDIVNVVAVIPGAMPEARARMYYCIAHLDSRASDPNDAESDAPGANDNASGTAALIELARVLSKAQLDSTVVLMATTGEEQGLFGARLHAQRLREVGGDVRAVLNNDTVGDPYGHFDPTSDEGAWARTKVRVFSEGLPVHLDRATPEELQRIARTGAENDSPARAVARYMLDVADEHDLPVEPMMIYRNDRFLRGGDHTAFLEMGFPAAVRITVPYEDYTRQHQDVRVEDGVPYGDAASYVDEDYLAGVTKLNLATLVHLANAPSAPEDVRVIVADLTNDTTLRWTPSPEPDVAGYEVVRRDTTSPVWQFVHAVDGGAGATEATLPYTKDNFLFGVRAVDANGFRSPVVFPIPARE